MSFNLRVRTLFDGLNHWGLRKMLVVETIRAFEPDIVGTQECLWAQAAFLQEQLPDYGFIGVGRNDGRRSGEMCGIFYRRDRFDVAAGGHFWLSKTPDRAGSKSWGSAFVRMVTWARLRDRTTGNEIAVFNTHFDVFGKTARRESARLLRERMHHIAPGLPTLVTGDFNDTEGSDTHRLLTAGAPGALSTPGDALVSGTSTGPGASPEPGASPRSGRSGGGGGVEGAQHSAGSLLGSDPSALTDTYRFANPLRRRDEGTRHDFSGRRGGPRIDWILATPHFTTLDADIDHTRRGARFPSDHFPVTAVVRLHDTAGSTTAVGEPGRSAPAAAVAGGPFDQQQPLPGGQ